MIETSRRAFLGVLGSAPLLGLTGGEPAPPATSSAIAAQSAPLRRTSEGRELSGVRYHNAESFFAPIGAGLFRCQGDLLYQTGIVLQLSLSSHLLDVGFNDAWCAQNVGLHVDRSLTYANATGLGHERPELARLAEFLSPYGRWRNAVLSDAAKRCPFSREEIRGLTRDLLERVREVTGHSRPARRRRLR